MAQESTGGGAVHGTRTRRVCIRVCSRGRASGGRMRKHGRAGSASGGDTPHTPHATRERPAPGATSGGAPDPAPVSTEQFETVCACAARGEVSVFSVRLRSWHYKHQGLRGAFSLHRVVAFGTWPWRMPIGWRGPHSHRVGVRRGRAWAWRGSSARPRVERCAFVFGLFTMKTMKFGRTFHVPSQGVKCSLPK